MQAYPFRQNLRVRIEAFRKVWLILLGIAWTVPGMVLIVIVDASRPQMSEMHVVDEAAISQVHRTKYVGTDRFLSM